MKIHYHHSPFIVLYNEIWTLKCDSRFYHIVKCCQVVVMFNRPSVAGAVLQTPPSLINHSTFPSKPSKQHYTQTVRARERKLWENIHPQPPVTCQVSCIMCQASGFKCHMSGVMCQIFFFDKVVVLVNPWSFINWAYPIKFYTYKQEPM